MHCSIALFVEFVTNSWTFIYKGIKNMLLWKKGALQNNAPFHIEAVCCKISRKPDMLGLTADSMSSATEKGEQSKKNGLSTCTLPLCRIRKVKQALNNEGTRRALRRFIRESLLWQYIDSQSLEKRSGDYPDRRGIHWKSRHSWALKAKGIIIINMSFIRTLLYSWKNWSS